MRSAPGLYGAVRQLKCAPGLCRIGLETKPEMCRLVQDKSAGSELNRLGLDNTGDVPARPGK